MPPADAIAGTLGGTRWLFTSTITSLHFYRHAMGLLDVPETVGVLLIMFFWYGVLFGVPTVLGFRFNSTRGQQLAIAAGCFFVILMGLLLRRGKFPISDMLRPCPSSCPRLS